jgi:5-methylcytosine-specific restriction enzyme A
MAGRTGKLNPNYKDGSSPERQRLYASAEWRALRRTVFARDGYVCATCGENRYGDRQMHLHHVKSWGEYPALRLDPDNIIVLCRECHHAEHRGATPATD